MAEKYYESPRNLDIIPGVNCEITVGRLSHAHKRDLRNYFGKYGLDRDTGQLDDIDIPAGLIEDKAIQRGLKKLVVGTDDISISNGPSPVDNFPDIAMGDEEDEKDLYEEVLKTLVDSNRNLARQWPFALVFGQYLALVNNDKDEAEKKAAEEAKASRDPKVDENPLPSETTDTPTAQRISGSDIAGKS